MVSFGDYKTPRKLKPLLQADWSHLLKVPSIATAKFSQELSLPGKMG